MGALCCGGSVIDSSSSDKPRAVKQTSESVVVGDGDGNPCGDSSAAKLEHKELQLKNAALTSQLAEAERLNDELAFKLQQTQALAASEQQRLHELLDEACEKLESMGPASQQQNGQEASKVDEAVVCFFGVAPKEQIYCILVSLYFEL